MRKAVGWLVWFGMVSISAGEIVAWKVPLERYSYQPGERLAGPPEASPFFSDGDELRDAGKPDGRNVPKVEWAVWNETTRTLVTKSSLGEVWPLRRHLDPHNVPRQCRLRLDVFETAGNEPVDADTKAAYTLEWLSGPGGKFRVMNGAEGKRIEVETDLTLDDTGETIHLGLEGTFQLPDQESMKIKTGFAVNSGSSLWVAGDRSNGKGMEVKATATTVLMDGTPLADSVRIQIDGQAVPIGRPRHSFERHRIDGKAWLVLGSVELAELLPEESQDSEDPFAEPGTEAKKPTKLERLKAIEVPRSIAEWFKGPVLDIREIVVGMGIEVTEGVDFAGYDVVAKSVVFFTTSDSEADKMGQVLTPGCRLRPKSISAGCEDDRKIHVMCLSSHAAYVARGADAENPVRSFELEPVIGESGLLQLKFRYEDRSSPEAPVLLDTSVTAEDGRAVEVMGGGRGMPLKLTGTVVEQ